MSDTTTWPENVIARYLTLGGATVGIIDNSHIGRVNAECASCAWTDQQYTHGVTYDTAEQTATRVADTLPYSRKAAQAHAEKCRALPKPTT